MAAIGSVSSHSFPTKLAYHWAEFVDCKKRLHTEGPFLRKILSRYREGLVMDAALGIGCESIFLLKDGRRVVSNEVDKSFRLLAAEKARAAGVQLDIRDYDWRSLYKDYRGARPDVVILMGNSLALLRNMVEMEQSLAEFYRVLNPGGCLVVDQRNFSYILKDKKEILGGKFQYSGRYVYCGTRVKGVPVRIGNKNVVFGYFNRQRQCVGHLRMLAFQEDELRHLLLKAGFRSAQKYFDFRRTRKRHFDFVTHVAFK